MSTKVNFGQLPNSKERERVVDDILAEMRKVLLECRGFEISREDETVNQNFWGGPPVYMYTGRHVITFKVEQ
jgi:hypothetical protein